jgi:predicted nucleotidyltransferase
MNSLLKSKVIEAVSLLPKIQFAAIFGSYAKNCNRTDSDLDIAIAAESPMNYKDIMHIKTELTAFLDKEIDLIDLNTVNGLILKEALCNCDIIVKKNTSLYANLIRKLIYDQTDMMPYYNRILKKRRKDYFHG